MWNLDFKRPEGSADSLWLTEARAISVKIPKPET
jgi:hypothetical protein